MFVTYIARSAIITSNKLSTIASVLSCYNKGGMGDLLQIFFNENILSNFQ